MESLKKRISKIFEEPKAEQYLMFHLLLDAKKQFLKIYDDINLFRNYMHIFKNIMKISQVIYA